MKKRVLFFFISLLAVFKLSAQEHNIGISFRPFNSYVSSSLVFQKNDSIKIKYNNESYFINPHLSYEILNNKSFFHSISLGVKIGKSFNYSKVLLNSKVNNTTEIYSYNNTFIVGYGFGKYFNIFKERLFIKLENKLVAKLKMSRSNESFKVFNINEEISKTLEVDVKSNNVYTLEYELNPSLLYKIKFFSIGVGLPIALQFNTFDGDIVYNFKKTNMLTKKTIYEQKKLNRKASYFYLRYNVELSLRFYFNTKKKMKKNVPFDE